MPRRAKIYVAIVIATAAVGLAGSMLTANALLPEPAKFVHCLVLALLTSTFKVRLPGMRNSIAASFVLFLIAIAHLSIPETLILTIPCTMLQILWRPRSRPKAIQVAFSVASTLVSTGVAATFFSSMNRPGTAIPALAVAAMAFFFVNSLLIATVLGLVQSVPIAPLWRECHRWALPYYLGGAVVAALVVAYSNVCGFHQALAMVPLVYSVYVCYDTYVAEETRQRALS